MNIYVNLENVNEAIKNLEQNKEYFVINRNLFSLNRVQSMLAPVSELDCAQAAWTFFSLFYENKENDKIVIKYLHEDESCLRFVKNCKLISEDDVNTLWEKSIQIVREKYKNMLDVIPSCGEIDNVFYNEVLVFISSKINETDKSNMKDDFISKFELYKQKKQKLTKETVDSINKLYDMIISIKLNK